MPPFFSKRAKIASAEAALIGVLITLSLISAAVAMRVEDYFPQGKRWWLRLQLPLGAVLKEGSGKETPRIYRQRPPPCAKDRF
jgi:hypothetical protein